ncbi:hypothetical protein RHMOL_Rhmol04G0152200 [Rhododendron molle]|nr:hypothetical protein RHMOL_Rhmol04G0152200 [Rhododendron molle]KAI8559168.1 hypothetical protein RHMOL_Rhmol04G0152200 [Rhododendron molle]
MITLQFKFAPDLIMDDAYETVESWMTTKNLNPWKLIPAMMCYSSEPHVRNEIHEVIKCLELCVHRLQNEDPGVHNLLRSLYAKQSVEGLKLVFVELDQASSSPEGCATRKIVEDVDKLVSCLVNNLAEIFDSSLIGAFSRSCEHVLNVVMQILGGENVGNALTYMAHLGLNPRLISKIADDAQGRGILEELEGIDTSFVV